MGTENYRMATTESFLRRGVEGGGDELIFTLDPAFQGLPDTAHGGSVLGAFRLIAGDGGPAEVRARYLKRVPLGVPLRLTTARTPNVLECRLLDASNTTLVDGSVRRWEASAPTPRDVAARVDAGASPPAASRYPLPVSRTCFACGLENPLGLHARLAYDDAAVAGTWRPRDAFIGADGSLSPVALTTLLDEAAFWLAALASGESGMTTDLTVTLHGPAPFGRAIRFGGRRDHVRQRADDPRYWDTEVVACDETGRRLAEARITFVAVRGAARRLAQWLMAVNPPEIVQRVFPAYAQ